MQAGYPDKAVLPGRFDACLLVGIALSSFLGQMMLNRSFQIQSAAKGSSIMCTQVRLCTKVENGVACAGSAAVCLLACRLNLQCHGLGKVRLKIVSEVSDGWSMPCYDAAPRAEGQ